MRSYKPKTIDEALKILDGEDCIVFAGGTDLMVKRKRWSGTEPYFEKTILFIGDICDLKNIKRDDNTLTIGSACTLSQIINSTYIPQLMKDVFLDMASPAIRNLATIGGNICNSSPAGDSLPLLYAADAILILKTMGEVREIPICQFITGPGRNVLNAGELLYGIKIPLKDFNIKVFKKVGTRKSQALSKTSFIGLANVHEGNTDDIRIAFGAAAPTVVRDRCIENKIINMIRSEHKVDVDMISQMYKSLLMPIDDQRSTAAYRKAVSINLLKYFLNKLS